MGLLDVRSGWRANKDAVDMLLQGLGYPSLSKAKELSHAEQHEVSTRHRLDVA